MIDIIRSYFRQEFIESWFFVAAGVFAIGCGAWLLYTGSSFRGAAWPLIAVALIQITVGLSVGLRTPKQSAALEAQLHASPDQFRIAELPRMNTVMKNFRLYKMIEIALAIVGLLLTYFLRDNLFWYAFGVGLLTQAGIMLVLDLLAEHRGAIYMNAVQTFQS
jgi:hypothetical protein